MASTTTMLTKKGLLHPPKWLPDNIMYEVIMGSHAYGVATESSDMDIHGFCVPPKNVIFPHLAGEIPGFGRQQKRFDQFRTKKTVVDPDARGGKGQEYDVEIYSIVRYFQFLMANNPDKLDSLFVPQNCILQISHIGTMVRESRHMFLHKGCWPRFKGYAYQQLHKIRSKTPIGKRKETVEKYGYDVKFGYHVVRLLDECEQILVHGDIDLQRNREQMKAVRRGEMSEEDLRNWFTDKERQLEKFYADSKLPHKPDEQKIRTLLLACLEEHYGTLADCVINPDAATHVLREINEVLEKHQNLL